MEIWAGFVKLIEDALKLNNDALLGMGVPYSFGFAIILFTLAIKLLTLPLTFQQLKASRAMQLLQPEIQKLQKKHKDNREALSKAQMELYKEAGVNPLAGCLPTLIQMPVWFALYQALRQLADQGILNQGFLWIPSLAEPKDMSWLWPMPPSVGWATAAGFLVLPILTVVTQVVVQKMMTPTSGDSQQAMMNNMMTFMPIMFGFFALQVPQGLVLYWVTSNLFSMVQQYFVVNGQKQLARSSTALEPAEQPPASKPPVTPAPTVTPGVSKKARDAKRKIKR